MDGRNSSFADRQQLAPVGGGFQTDDYWVWCGSAIRGEDGRYRLFASRWPRALSFRSHWRTSSEIVRAVADTPAGSYKFQEVLLPARGLWTRRDALILDVRPGHWDEHDPKLEHGDSAARVLTTSVVLMRALR